MKFTKIIKLSFILFVFGNIFAVDKDIEDKTVEKVLFSDIPKDNVGDIISFLPTDEKKIFRLTSKGYEESYLKSIAINDAPTGIVLILDKEKVVLNKFLKSSYVKYGLNNAVIKGEKGALFSDLINIKSQVDALKKHIKNIDLSIGFYFYNSKTYSMVVNYQQLDFYVN